MPLSDGEWIRRGHGPLVSDCLRLLAVACGCLLLCRSATTILHTSRRLFTPTLSAATRQRQQCCCINAAVSETSWRTPLQSFSFHAIAIRVNLSQAFPYPAPGTSPGRQKKSCQQIPDDGGGASVSYVALWGTDSCPPLHVIFSVCLQRKLKSPSCPTACLHECILLDEPTAHARRGCLGIGFRHKTSQYSNSGTSVGRFNCYLWLHHHYRRRRRMVLPALNNTHWGISQLFFVPLPSSMLASRKLHPPACSCHPAILPSWRLGPGPKPQPPYRKPTATCPFRGWRVSLFPLSNAEEEQDWHNSILTQGPGRVWSCSWTTGGVTLPIPGSLSILESLPFWVRQAWILVPVPPTTVTLPAFLSFFYYSLLPSPGWPSALIAPGAAVIIPVVPQTCWSASTTTHSSITLNVCCTPSPAHLGLIFALSSLSTSIRLGFSLFLSSGFS